MGSTPGYNKQRRQQITRETGDCGYCEPHRGENNDFGEDAAPWERKQRRRGEPKHWKDYPAKWRKDDHE